MAGEGSGPTMGGVSSITSNSSHMFMQHIPVAVLFLIIS